MFKHQDLQMFGLDKESQYSLVTNLNKSAILTYLKLWVAITIQYDTFIINFHPIKDQRYKYKYIKVHVRVYIIKNTRVLYNKIE